MKKDNRKGQIIIYQTKSGAIDIKRDVKSGTIWATQAQIVKLFGVDQSVVSRHIKNIFKDEEIEEKSNMQKMHNANSDKPVSFYSLDIILAVGYRTNSVRAIEFRKWATKTLRTFITDGYVINKDRVAQNYQQFLEAVSDVKKLLSKGANIDTASILELVNMFASTWLSLDAYDKGDLETKGKIKRSVVLTAENLTKALDQLKTELMKKGQASSLFASESKKGVFAGIVGNVRQTFAGKELYASVEEKAAHLLYFIVKDHPFSDGNKRSGAFAFAWFLQKAGILNKAKITPPALTALTILVAESHPKERDKMIQLILTLLK
jgi:prophage maintenance system killer protein/prophage antirepressor-like protein